MSMSARAAQFVDVSKTYAVSWRPRGVVHALRGVSFDVELGEVFALLGPNRAGKTTLLKILLGLCRPSGGRVFRLGRPFSERDTLARVGYMHENQAFPRYFTAQELLESYGALSGMPRSLIHTRAGALLDRMQLADRSNGPIGRFSKGMVQRLALAQAILAQPDLLVLDEPMEGLDLSARRILQEIVREQRRAGKSVLVVSHTLSEVVEVCDRLAVLVDGRLAYLGSLASLLSDPATGEKRSLESALGPIYRS